MFTPITDPTDDRYMPSIVFSTDTGASFDTVLSVLGDLTSSGRGWCVDLHLHADDGVERAGWVDSRHPESGENIVLRHWDTDEVLCIVPLVDVRYIQVG